MNICIGICHIQKFRICPIFWRINFRKDSVLGQNALGCLSIAQVDIERPGQHNSPSSGFVSS